MRIALLLLVVCLIGCQEAAVSDPPIATKKAPVNPEYLAALDEHNQWFEEATEVVMSAKQGKLKMLEKVQAMELEKYRLLAEKFPEHRPVYDKRVASTKAKKEAKAEEAARKEAIRKELEN